MKRVIPSITICGPRAIMSYDAISGLTARKTMLYVIYSPAKLLGELRSGLRPVTPVSSFVPQ